MPGSRKLGRPTDHRKSMLRGMVTFLLENGKHTLPKRTLLRSFLMKLLLSMQTETAVIAVLSKQALVVVTQQRCASSSLLTDNT